MSNKNFYIHISLRIILIIGLSIAGTYYVIIDQNYWMASTLLVILIITVVLLIKYFNNINRWMAFFLLGIENEDTTLKPPPKSGNKSIDDVYQGMHRLNDIFKSAKIEINTQEQYFKKVIKQSATGLFSINGNNRIININSAATKLTQLYEFHHVNTFRHIDAALPKFLTHHPLDQNSAIFENQFGQKLLFKLSEIKTQNERIRLVAVSDITKELDNGEVEAWIKLARTLSHEIMNNIAPITTLSQVISGYYKKEDQAIEVEELNPKIIANTIKGLNVIQDRSSGLMKFVENYRKFTKLPKPEIQATNISEVLNDALLAIGTYPHFNQLTIQSKIPDKVFIETDAQLISQVIHNILKNAYESLIHSEIENPILKINLQQTGTQTSIEISNNGPSIPPEIKEQIFVPFFTTKEDGTGVGLSLSKQIMLKMDGDIYVTEKEEGFTCFVINQNMKT